MPLSTKGVRAVADDGFVLLILLAAIAVPLMLLAIGTLSLGTRGGLAEQVATWARQRARSAAESGLAEALFRARSSTGLGAAVTVARDLGDGRAFTFVTQRLDTDGTDNDGDGQVDESDENVLRVTCSGTFDPAAVILRMDLAAQGGGGLAVPPGAVSMVGTGTDVELKDSASIDGHNYNIDGSAGSAANDKYGMVAEPPHSVSDLNSMVPSGDRSQVTGIGSTPSFGLASSSTDLASIQSAVQAAATVTLTSSSYSSYSFGNASTGTYQITYCNDDVKFKDNSRGAGILFVTGDLKLEDTARFDGVVYVLGKIDMKDSSKIYGALVVGADSDNLKLKDSTKIRYSEPALTPSCALLGGGGSTRYTGFSGWSDVTP